jgi:2-(1,2-epoxy-1,2-dihydrophenyl)acetyl-CoA isomerase
MTSKPAEPGNPFEAILFAVVGGVAEITLNRPERLNAFTAVMHEELRRAFSAIEADAEIRAVLITGAGRGFCSGQDLNDRVAPEPGERRDLGASLRANYNPLVQRMAALPKPVVVAVNGVAAGAGANFALAGDIVLAARSARFIQSFAKLGLVPDAGGTYTLPRLAGQARALGLALLAEPLGAEQAAEWGLIWKVVDDGALLDEARAIAAHLAGQPTRGLALTKRAIRASLANDLAAQLELEAALQGEAGHSDDYQEGVRAFLEKRPARFTGR